MDRGYPDTVGKGSNGGSKSNVLTWNADVRALPNFEQAS